MFDNRKLAFSQTMLNHWTIVPILVLLFLGLNLAIGLLAARGHVKSTADHVVGGRSLSGPVLRGRAVGEHGYWWGACALAAAATIGNDLLQPRLAWPDRRLRKAIQLLSFTVVDAGSDRLYHPDGVLVHGAVVSGCRSGLLYQIEARFFAAAGGIRRRPDLCAAHRGPAIQYPSGHSWTGSQPHRASHRPRNSVC